MIEVQKQSFSTFSIDEIVKRAKQRGLLVIVEESTGYCASIQSYESNKVIIGADVGLNSSASCRISQDKFFTQNLLLKHNINCIPSQLIRSDSVDFEDLQLPCIVKPNNAYAGLGLSLVECTTSMKRAISLAREYSSLILLQTYVTSPEFRLVLLDGDCLFAYQRRPWKILGDGIRTIKGFINEYNANVDIRHKIDFADKRLQTGLEQKGKSLDSVLFYGEILQMFVNANLSCGGNWTVIENVHPKYSEIAAHASNAIGLRYSGVDIFCNSLTDYDPQYRIIEVNANPGFEFIRNNSSLLDKVFNKIVDALFQDH